MDYRQGLRGKIVLITGGGTGLGLACAKAFLGFGATVVISGRREVVLQQSVEQLKPLAESSSAKVFHVVMDVKSAPAVKAAVDQLLVLTQGALPSIIINNAAGNFISPAEQLSPNAWKSIMEIVFQGTVNVTMEIAKRWMDPAVAATRNPKANDQQVVFMQVGASYAGRGQPFLAASAAAKSATLSLTKSLAGEWGKHGFRLFMVSPGPIYTKGAFARLDPDGVLSGNGGKDQGSVVPIGRFGTQEEYGQFVAFLCSPAASWLTGVNVRFDGASSVTGGEFGGLGAITPAQWKDVERKVRLASAKDRAAKL